MVESRIPGFQAYRISGISELGISGNSVAALSPWIKCTVETAAVGAMVANTHSPRASVRSRSHGCADMVLNVSRSVRRRDGFKHNRCTFKGGSL